MARISGGSKTVKDRKGSHRIPLGGRNTQRLHIIDTTITIPLVALRCVALREALDPLIGNADKALRQMRQVHIQEGKADTNLTLQNKIVRHRRQIRQGSIRAGRQSSDAMKQHRTTPEAG